MALPPGARVQILSPVVRGRKGAYRKELDAFRQKGYTRARIDGEMVDLADDIELARQTRHDIDIVVDRLIIKDRILVRLAESLETALKLSDGLVTIHALVPKQVERATRAGVAALALERLRGLRYFVPRACASHVLVQQPRRRVQGLQRPR
jgi:excinuclease UvrABC ATPase subunit